MIVVRLHGGMGNQMFQYAFGRALSLKYGLPLKLSIEAYQNRTPRPFAKNFPIRSYDLDVFAIKGEIAKKEDIPWIYRMHGRGRLALIVDALTRRIFVHRGQEKFGKPFKGNIVPDKKIYLDGWWQSPRYFAGYEDEIRKDFTLKVPFMGEIGRLMEEIKSSNSLCVHVRRTDYLKNSLYAKLDKEYYKKGIEYINAHASIEKIYVFSDDIEWCKANLQFGYPVAFVGPEYAGSKAEGQLMLMAACRYFIIANSTFSWWGAWLSNREGKIVVAPKQWYSTPVFTEEMFPADWIKI